RGRQAHRRALPSRGARRGEADRQAQRSRARSEPPPKATLFRHGVSDRTGSGGLLERTERLPYAEAVHYILEAAAGVGAAHALGIVHRDLKPSNLFLSRDDNGVALVKVVDFGLAKEVQRDTTLTSTSTAVGSPEYMAPEQARASQYLDVRVDVWALGVCLY